LTITAPAAGDFSISASPGTVVTRTNGTATYTVSVTRSGGFSGNVTPSVTGVPSGATATFSPNPIALGSSTLSVGTDSAAVGTYTLTITGTSGALSHSTSVSLKIH